MRLSEYTDYSLRVLMHCALHADRLVTITELTQQHGLSRNHVMKIVSDLARSGLLATTRGRGGGLRLGRPASEIRVGDVVRECETDFRLVECFDERTNHCALSMSCRLRHVFQSGLQAYFRELDTVTLADLIADVPAQPSGFEPVGIAMKLPVRPAARR